MDLSCVVGEDFSEDEKKATQPKPISDDCSKTFHIYQRWRIIIFHRNLFINLKEKG